MPTHEERLVWAIGDGHGLRTLGRGRARPEHEVLNDDVAFAAVSIAPLEKLLSFKERMGWGFPWMSSAGTDFNRNFHDGTSFPSTEAPGLSVFAKDADGQVYHTYSRYGRGTAVEIALAWGALRLG